MTNMMQDILKLSVSERILMVEAIWDSIAESDSDIVLTESTKKLLDERLESHNTNKQEGSTWEDVKARIKSKL